MSDVNESAYTIGKLNTDLFGAKGRTIESYFQ
jgi:hypothetical protein